LGASLEGAVRRNADGIVDREELTELIEQGQSEAGVTAQLDRDAGEADCKRGTRRSNMGTMRA
jgi:hypothetical protein